MFGKGRVRLWLDPYFVQPVTPKPGRVEVILHVTVMTACVWVVLSVVLGYWSCGFGSLTWLAYAAELSLGGIFWVPGTLFGLLMHASTRANSEQWSRVTLAFMGVTLAVCVLEAAVFHPVNQNACVL